MKARHPDDFALLRYTAGDLDESERGSIVRHLDECEACLVTLAELRPLHAALGRIGSARASLDTGEIALAPDDPFRQRPARSVDRARIPPDLAESALFHAERADAELGTLLAAIADSPEAASAYLARLSFEDPATRYLVLYALEEATSRTSETPAACLRFAEEVIAQTQGQGCVRQQADRCCQRSTCPLAPPPPPQDDQHAIGIALQAECGSTAARRACAVPSTDRPRRHSRVSDCTERAKAWCG